MSARRRRRDTPRLAEERVVESAEIDLDRWYLDLQILAQTAKVLSRQADAYARLFDRCTAVVADKHVDRVVQVLPDWWGVSAIALNHQMIGFTELLKAGWNPSIDAETLVRLLA